MSSHLRLVAATQRPATPPAPRVPTPRLALNPGDFEHSEKARRRFVTRATNWGRGAVRVVERLGATFTAEPVDRGVELRAPLEGTRVELAIEKKHLDLSLELKAAGLDAFARATEHDATMRWFGALPEQFVVRRAPAEVRVSKLDRGALQTLIEGARRDGGTLRIGWRLPRSVVLAHLETLDEQLVDALRALVHLEGAIAGRVAQTNESSSHARRMPASLAARTRIPTTGTTRLRLRGALGRSRLGAETPVRALDAGARVRVLAGPFEGKVGVVQAIDGRAARVLFGLLATRVELADLAPAHATTPASRPAPRASQPSPSPHSQASPASAPASNRVAERRPRPAIATSHRAPEPRPGRRTPT